MPMPQEVEDKGSLANVSAALGFNRWFSNKKPKIVKVGFYEKHHQHIQAWQTAQLLNMFDNFVKSKGIDLSKLKRKADVAQLILDMLLHYGCLWYWDPDYQDPMEERKCDDLFMMARDATIRLILDLGFRQCERENDAMGLRVLRRIMIPYFRNKSKEATSAYARNTTMDLVIEESSSPRSQERMNNLVCVNLSGTRGGYSFRDKVNEWYVQQVKKHLGRQHSGHHSLEVFDCFLSSTKSHFFLNAALLALPQIQSLVKSLSPMQDLHRFFLGKH